MKHEKQVKYLGAVQKGAAPPADYHQAVRKMNRNESSSTVSYFLKRKEGDRMNHYSIYARWSEETVLDFVEQFNEKRIA